MTRPRDGRDERDGGDESRNGATGRGRRPPPGRPVTPPSAPDPRRYLMSDLERETGFSARTIRYYIAQGLLAPAHGRGPTATYDLGHLLRLKMINLLKAEYLPLDDIKARLHDLTDDELARELNVQTRPAEDRWRRVLLHPDVELHVRERAGRGRDAALDEAVDQLVKHAEVILMRLDDRR